MNVFANYDRAEAIRDTRALLKDNRDEWVREKADEISSRFPELVDDFVSAFTPGRCWMIVAGNETAQDAYADFVEKVCLAEAEKMAKENEFINGNFSEVA